jgi:hypothetical protein
MQATARRNSELFRYLESLSKAVFQTGIAWQVVENRWDGTREAFHDFDPEYVANLAPHQIDRLLNDARIVRNRRKVEAIVLNARRILAIEQEYGSFHRYLRSFGNFDDLLADLQQKFKYLGETGAYHFLWKAGEEVPAWGDFMNGRNIRPSRAWTHHSG